MKPSARCFKGVSRRTFLNLAAGALASALPPKTAMASVGRVAAAREADVDCVLLDSGPFCALPESLAGYQSALWAAALRFVRADSSSVPRSKALIIPACIALSARAIGAVATALEKGSCVALESGAAFAMSEDFSTHQKWLRDHWGLNVEMPVDLWESRGDYLDRPESRGRFSPRPSRFAHVIPYIDLSWPSRIKVRDFSWLVPVSAPPEQIVGWCGGRAIAWKRAVERGTLVYLGSPLGPALRAGDAEACRWLREVVA